MAQVNIYHLLNEFLNKGIIFAIEKETFFKKISESNPKLIMAFINMLNLIELRITSYLKVHNAIVHPGYYNTDLNVKTHAQQLSSLKIQMQRNSLFSGT